MMASTSSGDDRSRPAFGILPISWKPSKRHSFTDAVLLTNTRLNMAALYPRAGAALRKASPIHRPTPRLRDTGAVKNPPLQICSQNSQHMQHKSLQTSGLGKSHVSRSEVQLRGRAASSELLQAETTQDLTAKLYPLKTLWTSTSSILTRLPHLLADSFTLSQSELFESSFEN
jgi:hypothetical protein